MSHQLFQLMAAGPQEPPDAKQFLDSFELRNLHTGKAEPKPTTPKASAVRIRSLIYRRCPKTTLQLEGRFVTKWVSGAMGRAAAGDVAF